MSPSSSSPSGHTSALTAAVAVLALAGCSSSGAGRPEPAGAASPRPRVLFQAQGQHTLVALADLDGSHATYPLDDLPGGNQTNPDWSTDGTRFVFALDDGSRESLWVSDADGGNAHVLLPCAAACAWLDDPDWSPDGESIVYSRTESRGTAGWGSLEVVDVDTGRVTVVLAARLRTFTSGARWSPDGSQIVFESVHKDGPGIGAGVDGVSLKIVAADARKAGKALTEPELFAVTADWSPDGTSIVYSALAEPGSEAPDLFVISPQGGDPRRVTNVGDAGGYAAEPAWRADSTRIVFSGGLPDGPSGVLLTVPADGSAAPVELGTTRITGRHPRVEPGA